MGQISTTMRAIGFERPMERLANGMTGCGNCKHSYTSSDLSLNCKAHGFYVAAMAVCKEHTVKPTPQLDEGA
jgi:hypothetical protein